MSAIQHLLLGASVPAGVVVGAAWAAVARRIPEPAVPLFRVRWERRARAWLPRPAGSLRRTPPDPACLAGAAVPVAAWLVAPGPAALVVAAAAGWLLLGIAVCDERTLRIPHALWIAGTAVGLATAWGAAGPAGALHRVAAAIALPAGLLLAACAARALSRRPPVGSADYGVIAFVAALCGARAALDVVIVGGVLALGAVAVQASSPDHRLGASLLASAAAAAGVLLGVPGAAAGAVALVVCVTRAPPTGRRGGAAPFGACLAAGVFCITLGSTVLPLPWADAVGADPVLHHLRRSWP